MGSDSQTAAAELILTIEPDGVPQRLVLPQIASGGSWKTHLHLLNPSPSEASVRIVFRSDAGELLTVPLTLDSLGRSEELSAAEISETIPPWSSLHVRTPGEHAEALVGWAEILHLGPLTGYATFEHFKSPGIPTDLLPALAPSLLLPFDNANGCQVGVALMNGDTSAPAAITLTIWDSDWVRIESEAFDLPPSGHLSFMLAERHPATAGKRGVLEFRTAPDGRIGGLGLQFDASGRFVSIPRLTTSRVTC